jgi:hypothetical protein
MITASVRALRNHENNDKVHQLYLKVLEFSDDLDYQTREAVMHATKKWKRVPDRMMDYITEAFTSTSIYPNNDWSLCHLQCAAHCAAFDFTYDHNYGHNNGTSMNTGDDGLSPPPCNSRCIRGCDKQKRYATSLAYYIISRYHRGQYSTSETRSASIGRRLLALDLIDISLSSPSLDWQQLWGVSSLGAVGRILISNNAWLRFGLFGFVPCPCLPSSAIAYAPTHHLD